LHFDAFPGNAAIQSVMHLYFMGIGGTAMGSVAMLLQRQGHQVTGSDMQLYPPMSDQLAYSGITVHAGYDASRLAELRPDLVVVGNVIGRGNPEIEWLLETRQFPLISLPQLIGEKLIGRRSSIVVAGTHGKTTTTALTTHLLKEAGANPGYMIAGVMCNGMPSSDPGSEHAPFVIEGDEYDTAFFDKRSKFVHYLPKILIINNLEFDHGDIFRDLQDIQRSFSHVLRLVPRSGHVLINGDDDRLSAWVQDEAHCRVWRVGLGNPNDLIIHDFHENRQGSSFELTLKGNPWLQVCWELGARFNARNAAMAALASALVMNPEDPCQFQSKAFASFSGVRRRQQILHAGERLTIIEDFGHHPTAVRETILSCQHRFPRSQVWCAFEPRSNTSRSPVFQSQWPHALCVADRVWLGAVHRHHLLQPNQRLNTDVLASELTKSGTPTHALTDNDALRQHLTREVQSSQENLVLIFFTNGSFDGIIGKCLEALTLGNPDSANS
jgi:UDP-N-acetylmuramate: L-alanyl-gamma-D-glutamyl-meso-diaminopimelate ligase